MKTAAFIKQKLVETSMGFTAEQKLYRLTPPLDGFDYVVVSACKTIDHGDETYIFGADEKGKVVRWTEMEGSFVGGKDHEQALRGAGYEVLS